MGAHKLIHVTTPSNLVRELPELYCNNLTRARKPRKNYAINGNLPDLLLNAKFKLIYI